MFFLAGSQAGKARDCYSRHAQVRILPGQPIFEGRQGSLVQWEERGSHKAVADGSNPSRATSGGTSGRSSGLYPLRRQISAARQVRLLYPLPNFRAGSSTDQNSWPTPNRCGFNSRTAHQAGLARRSSPRSITARRWFDSNILHHFDVEHG
jgi:hypothetical protein